MEMKFRKLWPLVGALCATAFSSAFAHSNYSSNGSMDSSSSSQAAQNTYQRGTFREITPIAGPRVAHGADVFITANFIWWKAAQDGLDYSVSGVRLGGDTSVTGTGSVSDPGFSWDPGFKVGLGLNMSHDGWDLFAQYTWLHSNHNNTSKGGQGLLNFVSAFNNSPSGENVSRSASWDFHFNVIDLELGRNFYLSQFLMTRLFTGLKFTWQDQDFKATERAGEGGSFNFGGNPAEGPFVTRQNLDTWGMGIRSGLQNAFHFSTEWSIYANLAFSGMWTSIDSKRKDDLSGITPNPAGYNADKFTSIDTKKSCYRIRYVGELELGLRWETWFYDDNYHFAIDAGYEQQVWINNGAFIRLGSDDQGDLSLHGLNLKFRFDF